MVTEQEWSKLVATVVDEKLDDAERFMTGEAEEPELKRLLSEEEPRTELQPYIERLQQRSQYLGFINSVLVTDKKALVLAAAPVGPPEYRMKPVIGNAYLYREWFNGEADFLKEKREPRQPARRPRQELGLTLAYKGTQAGSPMLVALAVPVRKEPKGEILGVLQATIHVKTFSQWLEKVEVSRGGRCPARFSLLLNHRQLVRHPCLSDEELLDKVEDKYVDESSEKNLLKGEMNFQDPLRRGVRYFAAASPFETEGDDHRRFREGDGDEDGSGDHRQWTALVLHDRASAIPGLSVTILPVLLLAGVTGFVGYLLFRDRQ